MTPKQRILCIRLSEKLSKNSDYSEMLEIGFNYKSDSPITDENISEESHQSVGKSKKCKKR